ncbi:MAG: S9 family peptidase [Nitriliruptoraceae bacterium]
MTDIRNYLQIRTSTPGSWSPDGARLLVSSDLSGTHQVHWLETDQTLPVDADDLPAVTRFGEPVGAGYLPTESRLLFTVDAGGNERTQILVGDDGPPVPYATADDLEPVVVDPDHIHRPGGVTRDGTRFAYSTNGRNGVDFDVWIHTFATGHHESVHAPGGWAQAVGFDPSGCLLAVSEPTTEPGDNRLHLLDLESRDVVELAPHEPSALVGAPSWMPDGETFFFSTDVGREFSAVARGTRDGNWEFVVDADGDSGCLVDWTGRHLLVVSNIDGVSRAWLRDPVTLEVHHEVSMPGDGVASNWRFSRDGRWLSFGYSSPLIPGDAWRVDTGSGALQRLTTSPCDVDASTFVDAEKTRIPSFDGVEIPLFVLRPRGAHGSVPVVVIIHGGPESQYRPSFSAVAQYLVARGFAVVAPNVRGSTGYGRTFQHLDDVEKRFDAIADLEAIHDWLATQPDLDEQRAALYGGSYGGYMVLAGLAFQPDRWAAGVDIVGMSNLESFLQNTSAWRRPYREREYGSDPELLRRLSPIHRVDDIRAPLFIVHGANDPRVPLSEAEQIHAAVEGSVLRVYEDEGHGLAKLDNRIDCYPRIASFLHDALGGMDHDGQLA